MNSVYDNKMKKIIEFETLLRQIIFIYVMCILPEKKFLSLNICHENK